MNRQHFLLRERYAWTCAWCGRQVATEEHHLAHKGMGGRHGEARRVSESEENKCPLCIVCHGAAHGERVFDTSGFSCAECDRECQHRMIHRPV